MDTNNECLKLGEINFSEYKVDEIPDNEVISLAEYTMGKIKLKPCNCEVEIYDREGPIPHFHIIGDLCTAIEIYRPKYFKHGPYKDSLTRKQKAELDKWMKENENERWNKISDFWKTHATESDTSMYKDSPPDYNKL